MNIFGDNKTIPILTYHSIDNSNSVISVSPESFEKQMEYLKENGYKTMSLCDVISYVQVGKRLPKKRIAITFDDGFKNNYTHAFPILKKYQFTATIFVTTDYCGKTNNWKNQHHSIPPLPMLSWEEIKEMSEYGIEFGAHTRSHPRLTEIDTNTAQEEIIGSKKDIETHQNRQVEFFSYPYGSFNKPVKEIVKTVFKGAVSNMTGKVNCQSDIYALKSINAASQIFKSLPIKVSFFKSFNLYLLLKKTVNKVKALS